MHKQTLSQHLHILGKFRRRLAGDIPEAERTRLESVVKTYERLYPEPKEPVERYGRG